MASTSDDATIKIWSKDDDGDDNPNYRLVSTLHGYHSRTIYSCSWNHDGTLLASVRWYFIIEYKNFQGWS